MSTDDMAVETQRNNVEAARTELAAALLKHMSLSRVAELLPIVERIQRGSESIGWHRSRQAHFEAVRVVRGLRDRVWGEDGRLIATGGERGRLIDTRFGKVFFPEDLIE